MTQTLPAPTRLRSASELSKDEIDQIGRELDQIREEVMASRGSADAAYIRTVIKTQRGLELAGRVVLLFSGFPPAWILGTAALSIAKILENMEIGHNVLHGQWDWMRDPKIHSTKWEWDHASPAAQWKHSHNDTHHTYTNVLDLDNDLGYGIMRVDPEQPWTLYSLFQAPVQLLNALFFEYGIAAYDLETKEYLEGRKDRETFHRELKAVLHKIRRQFTKDYLVHPLLSGPNMVHTLTANLVANLIRNVWSHSVIVCGHFPDGVDTFHTDSIEGETRGEWYLRQMRGSANISGSRLLHIMTGNLSHQIEHHLFPDMPSNRYGEVAVKVREVFARHRLRYVTGPLYRQLGSAWWKVLRLSLPNREEGRTRAAIVAGAVRDLAGRTRASLRQRGVRRAVLAPTAG